MARSWRSAISEEEDGQQTGRREREDAKTTCTYCGLALAELTAGSGDIHRRIPVQCPHGGFVHASCMLERADRLARGHIDTRSCVACSSEWAGGRQPPHSEELANNSGLPTNESGQRWASLRSTVQSADLLQRDVPGPGPASYLTTGIYSSCELMVRAHGRSPTSSFLLLFSDALGLPQEAYLEFLRSREWEVAVDRCCTLFVAFGIRS